MTAVAAAPAAQISETEAQTRPALMRNRTFLAILAGHTISVLGDGFHSVAMGLWILNATGSAKAMATVMALRVVIGILLGPVAGTVADRVDRRKLMIVTDVIRFGLVSTVAYLVYAGSLNFPVLLVLAGAIGVASQFFSPAFQASLADIVNKEDLPKASSLLQMVNTLSQVVGPLLGGTVVGLFGAWAAISGDALSFLISGLAILAAGAFASTRKESKEAKSFWADMQEGLAYIKSQPLVRSVVVLAPVINFFGNAMGVLMPVIAVKIWLANSVQFGLLSGFLPLGFAVGAVLVMAFSKKMQRRGWWMMASMTVAGLLIAVACVVPSFSLALPFLLGTGIMLAIVNVLFQITLQAEVPSDVQGRVFGTLSSLVNVASPLSMLVAGVLGDAFSPALIGAVAGLSITAVAVGGLMVLPALRNYR